MLDPKLIRNDPEGVERKLRTKDPKLEIGHILELDRRMREVKVEVEELKSERNSQSKKIGEMKRSGEDTSEIMSQMGEIAERVKVLDHELKGLEEELEQESAKLPNLPADDIKVSLDPKDNVLVKEWGNRPDFGFSPKNHLELNEKLGVLDFKRGAKLTGAGWPVYCGLGARLEWALLQYMMQVHLDRGYTPYIVPHCVNRKTMFGVAQLPKFEDQLFKTEDGLYLIPTSEAALNGLFADEILTLEELPKRMVSCTPCFRREAGAAGASERGLIRVHQFNKVEMYCISKPEESSALLEEMLAGAEAVLQGLGLHYRNMLLVTGDMSFASRRTIDIEVWLPGQDRYYEVSSVSDCGDFQARRAKIRYRGEDGKPRYAHTLNGSGVATARLMVALLENFQQEDGSVLIPKVLQPYLGNLERL